MLTCLPSVLLPLQEKLREAEEDDSRSHRDSRRDSGRPRSSRDTDVLMDYGGSSSERRRPDESRRDRGGSSGTKRTGEDKDGYDRSERKGSQADDDERQAKVRLALIHYLTTSPSLMLFILLYTAPETERTQFLGTRGRRDLDRNDVSSQGELCSSVQSPTYALQSDINGAAL